MPHGGLSVVLLEMPVPHLEEDGIQAPGGPVSLATYAARLGFAVSVSDLAGVPPDHLLESVPPAKVYGFSLYSVTYSMALDLLAALRRSVPGAFFVAGGPHASALPVEVSRDFDTVVVGEGELAFADVLQSLSAGRIPPRILRAEPIADLDALPFPDFQRFCRLKSYSRTVAGIPAISLDSSRGCPFRCRFCNSRVQERGRWRGRSPESVAREVAGHVERGWTAFRFNDDSFAADPERVASICRLLRPLGIRFRIFARAEDLTAPRICELLAEAGCVHVSVGVESLSPVMLGRMGKATSVARIRAGIDAARGSGMRVRGYFVIGFPGETDDTVAESIGQLDGLHLDEAMAYPCIPYPGTDLFARPDYYGITWMDPDFSHYVQVGRNRSAGFVMRTRTFGPDEVRKWRALFISAIENRGMNWYGK